MNAKHPYIVLNLTSIRGVARSVLAQNAIKVLKKLGYRLKGLEDVETRANHATFIVICTACRMIYFSRSETFNATIPQFVPRFDVSNQYNEFITAAKDGVLSELEKQLAYTSLLLAMLDILPKQNPNATPSVENYSNN